MRTYGRIVPNVLYPDVTEWVEVTTDANGFNDWVWLTTLIQVLKLNLGESPFWGNYGIPAKPSVVMQVYPDYYVAFTQKNFSKYFASLIIVRDDNQFDTEGRPVPTYNVRVVTHFGVVAEAQVPV